MHSRPSSLRQHLISKLSALVFLLSFAVPASAVDFLETIQDIPLPTGFVELKDPVEFETPFGRIVETSAYGQGEVDVSMEYYRASLPAFGWALTEESMVFERVNERLYISVTQMDDGTRVDFKLVVKPASSKMND